MVGLAALNSHAHRFYAAFSQIDIRPDKGTIEIIHRLSTHDVEDLLKTELKQVGDVSDEQIETFLKKNVEAHFGLSGQETGPVSLTWVGYEYAADNIYVYQEAKLPASGQGYTLKNRILFDILSQQRNTVNISKAGVTNSYIFTASSPIQNVQL